MALTSFFDVLCSHAAQAGDVIAAVDALGAINTEGPPASLTYSELHDHADRLASVLVGYVGNKDAQSLATWMRRGNRWYCVFWACVRLGVPIIALSCDLPDKGAEQSRNDEIFSMHNLALLVIDALFSSRSLAKAPAAITFEKLWAKTLSAGDLLLAPVMGKSMTTTTLCYCYTGGTTKASRCVRISHEMAIHETLAYPRIAKLSKEDRVLQQHSLYWGASAYGEIDIALSFGCALVFSEMWDPQSTITEINAHKVTCAGLVPTILATFEPSDVPNLRLVFTWGEALQVRTARLWAQKLHLIDLLISTEYWLSFYADWSQLSTASPDAKLSRPVFRAVPGTELYVQSLEDVGSEGVLLARTDIKIGELFISGPMVSPGYTDALLNETAFKIDTNGSWWYRTNDCVQQQPDGGFVFHGRTNDLVKVGGVWVDTEELEERLMQTQGVVAACFRHRAAFVVLDAVPDGLFPKTRAMLPEDFGLFMVPELPRRPGTDKINYQALQNLVCARTLPAHVDEEAKLCGRELASMLRWYFSVLLMFVISAGISVSGSLSPILNSYCGPLDLFLRLCVNLSLRVLCLTYMILSTFYIPSRLAVMFGRLPCGLHLVPLILSLMMPPTYCVVCATHGVYTAVSRGRLFSWPLVCIIGFPIWIRDCRPWSSFDLIRLYMSNCILRMHQWKLYRLHVCLSFFKVRRFFPIVRQCDWCALYFVACAGPEGASTHTYRYCGKCGTSKKGYAQCTKCATWDYQKHMHIVSSQYFCTMCEPCPTVTGSGDSGMRESRKRPRFQHHTFSLPEMLGRTDSTHTHENMVDDDVIYALRYDHTIVKQSLSAAAPSLVLSSGSAVQSIQIVGNVIYGVSTNKKIYKKTIDSCNPSSPWTLVSSGAVVSICIKDDMIYGVGKDHRVYQQRFSTMSPSSHWNLAARGEVLSVAVGDNAIYGVGANGKIYLQDLGSMSPSSPWVIGSRGCVSSISVKGNLLYAVGTDMHIYVQPLSSMNAQSHWQLASRCNVVTIATVDGERLPWDEVTEPPRVRQRTRSPIQEMPPLYIRAENTSGQVTKSRTWKMIEIASGVIFPSLSDPLSNLDSLRRAKLVSAILRDTGKRLPREAFKGSKTLGDLINEIETTPLSQSRSQPRCTPEARRDRDCDEYPLWGTMWQSRCAWVIRRDRPLHEGPLRAALIQLVQRHAALRTSLRDPYQLFGAAQQALTTFQVLRRHCWLLSGAHSKSPCSIYKYTGFMQFVSSSMVDMTNAILNTVAWSFWGAWPCIAVDRSSDKVPLAILDCSKSLEEAENNLWLHARSFLPPFQAILAPFGVDHEEGAVVYLAVSHMLSDGFSIVPLLRDLAELVSRAEAGDADTETVLNDLPAIPNMYEALVPRLKSTIFSTCVAAEGSDKQLITLEPIGQCWNAETCTVGASLPREVVTAIRLSAHRLAIPEDIALLSVIGVTLAWFQGQRVMPIAIIVPQRDGPEHNEMVGLFADFRQLCVCTDNLSFAGVALYLHNLVKERLWRSPGLATQFDIPLLNFEWTDFDEHGGFSQHVKLYERAESIRYPMKVVVEQSSRDNWRMRVAFQASMFDEGQRQHFFQLWERSFRGLLERPLDLVWSKNTS